MNPRLLLLLKKLQNNEDLQKFKNSDEFYEYCLKISDGYTKEEFDNFMKLIILQLQNKKNRLIQELPTDNLKDISGGVTTTVNYADYQKLIEKNKLWKDRADYINKKILPRARLANCLVKIGSQVYFEEDDGDFDMSKMINDLQNDIFDSIGI